MRQGWRAPGVGVESALKLPVPSMTTRRVGIRWSTSEGHSDWRCLGVLKRVFGGALFSGVLWWWLCLECSLCCSGVAGCYRLVDRLRDLVELGCLAGLWVGMVCGVGLVRGSCGRCGANCVGEDRCHCVRCCETWDDVELFTDHRRGEVCVSGAVLGLARTRNGIWLRRVDGLSQAS
jgi:hypothetical protein